MLVIWMLKKFDVDAIARFCSSIVQLMRNAWTEKSCTKTIQTSIGYRISRSVITLRNASTSTVFWIQTNALLSAEPVGNVC